MEFNGSDYDHEEDGERLSAQHTRIFNLMKDGEYRSLREISVATNAPEARVSAQLRHLRKERFGGHTVSKRSVGRGVYLYKLTTAEDHQPCDI